MTATQGTPARLQTKENGLYVASWRILCRILKDNEKSTQKEQVKSTRSASKPFSRLFGQTGWEKAKLLLEKTLEVTGSLHIRFLLRCGCRDMYIVSYV